MGARCWLRLASALAALLLGCVLPSPAQIITTIAGNVLYNGAPATQTPLSLPSGLAVDRDGNFWIADTGNHVIRRVDAATGIATIVAGGGSVAEPIAPIAAMSAVLEGPTFVVRDRAGNLYFCETLRHRVRKISPDGMLTTVAGTGQQGFSGDGGLATRATLSFPEGLAVDSSGNLYISDVLYGRGRVRKVTIATGIIATVAGGGSGGDGGPATSADLRGSIVNALALDRKGKLYLATFLPPDLVKRVDAITGIITTVAGGGPCCPENVPATSTALRARTEIISQIWGDCVVQVWEGLEGVRRSWRMRSASTAVPVWYWARSR